MARHWTPILFCLAHAACGGDAPTAASTATASPSSSDGGAVPEPPAPTAAAEYAKDVGALARQAGIELDLAASARRPTYVLTTDYDAATGRLQGIETFRWVNDGGPLEALTFEARTIGGTTDRAAGVAPTLTAIEVDGASVSVPVPSDGSSVYKVSHRIEPGRRVEVAFHFAWDLPAIGPSGPNVAEPLSVPNVAGMLGVAQSLDPAVYEGRDEARAVVAGLPYRWSDPRGFAFHVDTTIRTTGDWRVVANGVDVGRERSGPGRASRFVAMNAHGAALVVGRGWTEREVQVGRVGLSVWTLPASESNLAATPRDAVAVGRVRRAIETLTERWGPCPEARLTVIEMSGPVAGVASIPGMLLVTWPPARVPGTEAIPVLAETLARHPAREESLTFALAQATARAWWQERGADRETENLLAFGLGTAGALGVVAAIDGDKARRRAIALGLHIPFEMGRNGQGEPVLARLPPGPLAGAAAWKAGFWAERLERHLGEDAFAEAARALLAESAPIDRSTLERAFIARAARPDETRAFMRRWLDEAHAGEDVGGLDAGVLAEYLLVDGAIGGLEDELMRGPLGPRLLEALRKGKGLDTSLAIDALEGLTGSPSNPTLKAAMDIGRLVLGSDPETKKSVADQLVDQIGRELGISPEQRARLKTMTGLALDALHAPGSDDAPEDADPGNPATPEVRAP